MLYNIDIFVTHGVTSAVTDFRSLLLKDLILTATEASYMCIIKANVFGRQIFKQRILSFRKSDVKYWNSYPIMATSVSSVRYLLSLIKRCFEWLSNISNFRVSGVVYILIKVNWRCLNQTPVISRAYCFLWKRKKPFSIAQHSRPTH